MMFLEGVYREVPSQHLDCLQEVAYPLHRSDISRVAQRMCFTIPLYSPIIKDDYQWYGGLQYGVFASNKLNLLFPYTITDNRRKKKRELERSIAVFGSCKVDQRNVDYLVKRVTREFKRLREADLRG